MKARSLSTAVAVALLAASTSASALAPTEATALIPFNFSNPGARSLAMGGAFTGAADDATAALVNPAGLTRLGLEQQFSIEYRHNQRDVPYVSGGTVGYAPLDLRNVGSRNGDGDSDEISYVSWVLPRDSWSIALYRHEMVNFDGGHRSDPVLFADGVGLVRGARSRTTLDVVTYGASFAWNWTDAISLGAGITWNDFDMRSTLQRFDDDFVAVEQQQRGDDSDFGYNIGLLYRGSDNFSFGLSYRSAAEFRYRYTSDLFGENGASLRTADGSTPFKSPDVVSVGISWRPTDTLMVNLDVNRVGYSNITERVDNPFFTGEFAEFGDPQFARSIVIDDVIEPRLGLEYAIDSKYPLFLRGGLWHEKKHTLSFRGRTGDPGQFLNANGELDDELAAERYLALAEGISTAVLYSTGSDELHVTAGFGISFPNFQIDFGYDRSDRQDVLSLSGVYRF